MFSKRVVVVISSLVLGLFLAAGFPTDSKTAALPEAFASSSKSSPPAQQALSVAPGAFDRLALHVARRHHTATPLSDGRVIIIGGDNQEGTISEAETLDLSSGEVSVIGRSLVPRTQHTATRLADGRVLVAGGANEAGLLNSTEIFEPQTGLFSPGPRLQRARVGHSATLLENGSVLIAGGQADGSAEIFDPSTGRSALLENKMTALRRGLSAILLSDGNVLLVGGEAPGGHNLDWAEIFDTRASRFAATAKPMMIPRAHPALRVLPDGKVQVIGGDYDGTMEIYDPATGLFGAAAHLVPTADLYPASQMLSAQTRAGFIDSISYRDENIKLPLSQSLKERVDSFKQGVGRSGYASAEIAGSHRAVVVGGVDDESNVVRSVLVLQSSSATVSTDKVRYLPGRAPVITGTGWKPFERVNIIRQEARLGHKRTALRAVADELGNFICADLTPADHRPLTTYTLTARGLSSGQIAQTTYNDAAPPGSEKELFPKDLPFDFPVTARDGSTEVAAGLLRWRVKSPLTGDANVQNAKMATTAVTCSVPAGSHLNFPSGPLDLSGILNKPCLGLPPGLCGSSDVRLTEFCLAFSGTFHGRLVPLKVSLEQYLAGHAVFDLTLNGGITFEHDFPIPGLSIDFDIVDVLHGEVGLTIKGKVEVTFTTDTKLKTTVDLSEGTEFGFDDSRAVGDKFFNTTLTPAVPPVPSATGASLEVTQLGEIEATVKLGPNLGVSLTIGSSKPTTGPDDSASKPASVDAIEIGSAELGVFGFVTAKVTPTANTATCHAGTLDLHAGMDIDAGLTVANVDLLDETLNLFTLQIPGFPKPFFLGTDSTPPMITNVPNMVKSTDPGACSAVVNFAPTFNDDCSGVDDATKSISPVSGSTFPKGVTTVIVSVKDRAGNLTSTSFTVTVNDTQFPTISCPANVNKSTDPNQCGAVTTFAPVVTENCPNPTIACTPASGTFFPKGTTTVSCKVTDTSGNSSPSCPFTVTVNDTQAPTITCSNIIKSNDPNQCGAVVILAPTASDNCPGVTVACSPASGSFFPKGTTTVSCTAKDSSNNTSAPCGFTVTVNDTQPPTISCPPNQTAVTPTIGGNNVVVVFPPPTASDNCPGVTTACNPPSGATFPVGCTTVTCTATDTSNNTATCSFQVCVFNICLQDDSVGLNRILINSFTGDYRFCCNGTTLTGRGKMTIRGSTYGLEHNALDRRVRASVTAPARSGNASLQMPPGTLRCNITDSNTSNNTTCGTCQ